MVFITHVRMVPGGRGHEHIAEVRWLNPQTRESRSATVAQMVEFIEKKGQAKVRNAAYEVDVGVVRPKLHPPYLRTYADGVWKDNLLALPHF